MLPRIAAGATAGARRGAGREGLGRLGGGGTRGSSEAAETAAFCLISDSSETPARYHGGVPRLPPRGGCVRTLGMGRPSMKRRTVEILILAALLGFVAMPFYFAFTYTGPYRWLAEAQMSSGQQRYTGKLTFAGT